MTGLPSDEVAEDYKNSLEDLASNLKYEINNLTVIAKENVDHALAISRVLEHHIKTTPPNRKLPAFYVLDSVVKNVGSPYTLFFGRNLYSTYMQAYTLVDGPIRRKLEEMLKTWKEPVSSSMDSRPVFPPEVTRPIENALIKARTAAVQLSQKHQANVLPPRPGSAAWRATPTSTPPPGATGGRTGYPPSSSQQQGYLQYQASRNRLTSPPPASMSGADVSRNGNNPSAYRPSPSPQPGPTRNPVSEDHVQPEETVEAVGNRLAALIVVARTEFATSPYDFGRQQRLKALLDLQTILHGQDLSREQLRLINNQVSQMAAAGAAAGAAAASGAASGTSPAVPAVPPTPTPPPLTIPTSTPPVSLPNEPPLSPDEYVPPEAVPPPPTVAPVPSVPPPPPLDPSLLPPGALAALLAVVTGSQASSVPAISTPSGFPMMPMPAAFPAPPPVTVPPPPPPPIGESALLASLRAAGVLPPTGIPSVPVSSYPPSSVPAVPAGGRGLPFDIPNDVSLTSASLKVPRPHLISSLYESQPSQCSTCGRRFPATEAGRQKKARHLDWHFSVNIRMGEAIKRGQNRSWYVGEMDWIHSRDFDNENPSKNDATNNKKSNNTSTAGRPGSSSSNTGLGNTTGDGKGKTGDANIQEPGEKFILAPTDPKLVNAPCPICQERFETVWNDEAQEWVWMDAVKMGTKGRIYHASCYEEASREGKARMMESGSGATERSTGGMTGRSSGGIGGGAGGGNRTGTPDSAVLGKRKAEETDPSNTLLRDGNKNNKIKRESA
ncbi:MAG: hypothetical protein M1823_002146 [Watsoniomyces obsoletus]|nr:MAG: hypothetical protein M1823_002146 [Watsoniomyces obsoletus]